MENIPGIPKSVHNDTHVEEINSVDDFLIGTDEEKQKQRDMINKITAGDQDGGFVDGERAGADIFEDIAPLHEPDAHSN